MKKRQINWDKIKSILAIGGLVGAFGGMVTMIDITESRKKEVRNITSATNNESHTIYRLVDASVVEVKSDELSHIFNFDFGYMMIMGKINKESVDAAFTFEQFGRQDDINEVRAQGCAIAARTTLELANRSDSDSRTARDYAQIFSRNHCPQPPGPQP